MEEEIKKALKEYLDRKKEADRLSRLEEGGSNKSISNFTEEEFDSLGRALKKEKEAKTKYYTLLLKKGGCNQNEIDNWLRETGLL